MFENWISKTKRSFSSRPVSKKKGPDLLVIDVSNSGDMTQTGTMDGAINIYLGNLTFMADWEVPSNWLGPAWPFGLIPPPPAAYDRQVR